MSDIGNQNGDMKAERIRESVMAYLGGFALAVVITAIAFFIASDEELGTVTKVIWLCVLGVLQIIVHLVCFLHLKADARQHDRMMLVIFGAVVVLLFGLGTLWIMDNLNSQMSMPMPMPESD
jgi:cytochrome o ubiquinol oxidase subunit IV